jgi:hypothetical protein
MINKNHQKHQICSGTDAHVNPNTMECHSKNFLSQWQKSTAHYDYVLLDFLPERIQKSHSHYRLDLLVSPEHYNALLAVLSVARPLHYLRTRMGKHFQEIQLVFNDLSQITVTLRTSLNFKNLKFADPQEVFRSSRNENGFKIPSLAFTFEYQLMKSLSEKVAFPSDYSDYFSHCNFEERSTIFAKLVPKYKFVINVLDDLMQYKRKNSLLVRQSLRKMKFNKGIHLIKNLLNHLIGNVQALFFGRWQYFYSSDSARMTHPSPGEFLMRKTYLRAG